MTQFAISEDVYSPLPALMQEGAQIHVYGDVWYFNETIEYPAFNVSVRIFATDELKSEVVFTDADGYFLSILTYEAGQILTITIRDYRYETFIGYNELSDFYLGRFYIVV